MPRSATRRIVDMMRSLAQPRTGTLHLGEIFTGPGRGGTEAIRYHLGPDGLDSAFDFPLMWALREALAHDGAGFDAIDQLMSQTEHALQGSGSVMARIVGNHDTTRFISEAHGDAARDPWGPIVAAQPTVAESYQRHRLALGLLFTLPGIPVLYYGDEVGLAGGADPDSRRVMPALEGLGDLQGRLLEDVRRLGTLRRCSPALRRGRRVPFAISSDTYGFVRDAEDGAPAFVLITRSAEPQSPTVAASVATLFAMPGEFVDVLTGETFHLGDADTTIALAPRSIRVLVPVGHPCA
jgi:glycosidase